MTTSQRLKTAILSVLETNKPDESISIADAKSRAGIELPVLTVNIESVAAHSEVLQVVERVRVVTTLRVHVGDEEDGTIDDWIDQVEAILADEDGIKSSGEGLLRIFSFVYEGSTQNWDESILEVTFSAESLCARLP